MKTIIINFDEIYYPKRVSLLLQYLKNKPIIKNNLSFLCFMKQTNKIKKTPSIHIFHFPCSLHTCSHTYTRAGSAGHPAVRQPSHLSESPGKQLHKTRQQSRSDGALLGINERLISQVTKKKMGEKTTSLSMTKNILCISSLSHW